METELCITDFIKMSNSIKSWHPTFPDGLHFPYKCRAAAPCVTLYPFHPNVEMLKVNF